ncbi:MAG: succinylglutamate desuccinylase/aspartoacylase family protein [Limisphaerales bacterium]
MITTFVKDFALAPAAASVRRSLDAVLAPLDDIAARSTNLIRKPLGEFESEGRIYSLSRYVYLGPQGGGDTLRIGIVAAIHGDEPEGTLSLARFVAALEANPDIAKGYALFIYPVCNPTGFEDGTRHARSGRDLNREFWNHSTQPEVRHLESEIYLHAFHGIITLHTDDTSDGLYGFVGCDVLSEFLLEPALKSAAGFLPRNHSHQIDGFPAANGIINRGYRGMLQAPPGQSDRPFEITFETPQRAPVDRQVEAFSAALQTILTEYNQFIAYAQNI